MKYLLLLLTLLIRIQVYSQSAKAPVEVTPQLEKQIRADIEKKVAGLRQQLLKNQETGPAIEFKLDTFRVEKYMEMYITYDYSTAGMRRAAYNGAYQYDSLLNKYYKKLSLVLSKEDRLVLVEAQKAWISFRDKEAKLVELIGKDGYSGGGTIQQLIDASEYLDVVRQRTLKLFGHYLRATQEY
jgi:uncharacterized protein YecT (DUF1311 family)